MSKRSVASYTTTNQELLDLMGQLKLNKYEIEQTTKAIADTLTYEKTQELMSEILSKTGGYKEETNLDRFLWLTRMAYIAGFVQAMNVYSETIGHLIAEAINKNQEVAQ